MVIIPEGKVSTVTVYAFDLNPQFREGAALHEPTLSGMDSLVSARPGDSQYTMLIGLHLGKWKKKRGEEYWIPFSYCSEIKSRRMITGFTEIIAISP